MTRYKRYLKEVKDLSFNEDFNILPCDKGYFSIEDRDVFVCPVGLLVITTYNVGVARSLYLPNGHQDIIWEEEDIMLDDDDDEIKPEDIGVIKIFNEIPNYRFYYDFNDKLVAIKHCRNSQL